MRHIILFIFIFLASCASRQAANPNSTVVTDEIAREPEENTRRTEETTERTSSPTPTSRVTATLPDQTDVGALQTHLIIILNIIAFDPSAPPGHNIVNPTIFLAIDFGDERNVELSEETRVNLRLIAELLTNVLGFGRIALSARRAIYTDVARERARRVGEFLINSGVLEFQIRQSVSGPLSEEELREPPPAPERPVIPEGSI